MSLHSHYVGLPIPPEHQGGRREKVYPFVCLTSPTGSTTIGPAVAVDPLTVEGTPMTWEAPDFVEVKMDAEINSYQDDFGGEQDDRF